MSSTQIIGTANIDFTTDLLDLLEKWKLIVKEDHVQNINIFAGVDNSCVYIKKFRVKENN